MFLNHGTHIERVIYKEQFIDTPPRDSQHSCRLGRYRENGSLITQHLTCGNQRIHRNKKGEQHQIQMLLLNVCM